MVLSRLGVCVLLCDYMQLGEANCICFCGLSVSVRVCVCLFMDQSIKLSVNSADFCSVDTRKARSMPWLSQLKPLSADAP